MNRNYVVVRGDRRQILESMLPESVYDISKEFPLWDTDERAKAGWLIFEMYNFNEYENQAVSHVVEQEQLSGTYETGIRIFYNKPDLQIWLNEVPLP